jgi:hypothetical protein
MVRAEGEHEAASILYAVDRRDKAKRVIYEEQPIKRKTQDHHLHTLGTSSVLWKSIIDERMVLEARPVGEQYGTNPRWQFMLDCAGEPRSIAR